MIYKYGTSGYRFKIDIILSLSKIVGKAIAIISEHKKKFIGIMITASHNDSSYNGFKIISDDGNLLSKIDEENFTNLVDCNDFIPLKNRNCKILIGYDTRPSCKKIKKLVIEGLYEIDNNPEFIDFGLVTTPQMHYLTYKYNNLIKKSYVEYYNLLNLNTIPIIIDCSNGVGTNLLRELLIQKKNYQISLINTNTNDLSLLNKNCGSDYVCSNQKLPDYSGVIPKNRLLCSLDGDADRVVFYYYDDISFKLLDGDKIISLICYYLKQTKLDDSLSIGVVHTAYSNRQFKKYINNLGYKTYCVPTGVKNLHRKAMQFNIGVYFEANGHGTVLFNIDNIDKYPLLKELSNLFNQFIGDAITNLFAIMHILSKINISIYKWYNLYQSNYAKLGKIKVKNKSYFNCDTIESQLIRPIIIKQRIDELTKSFPESYIFVRPSGTEDVIRYYIESLEQENLNNLELQLIEGLKPFLLTD